MNVLKKNNEINYLVISSSVGNCLFNKIIYLLFERIPLPVLNLCYVKHMELKILALGTV